MADYTPTQGRYLEFIHAYTTRRGCPPSEAEIALAMCVSAPSVNQMVKVLERKGLIERQPGLPRSIRVLLTVDELPSRSRSGGGEASPAKSRPRAAGAPAGPPINLYVLQVFLIAGPVGEKYANKQCRRDIEIRGDQSLERLHLAIFEAFDRSDARAYEFHFGKRPFTGPYYGAPGPGQVRKRLGDARTTTLDALGLKADRVFGYRFDFDDQWFHQVDVARVEAAIPTVAYPRVIKRVGQSPPQHDAP